MKLLNGRIGVMVLLLLTLAVSISAVSAEELGRNDCSQCHGNYVSDFYNPSVPIIDRVRCYGCHSQGLHTAEYNNTSLFLITYTNPDTGKRSRAYFKKDPSQVTHDKLHEFHSQPDPRAGSCTSCHINYTCFSCHDNVPHGSHGKTKYPQVSIWMTSGVYGKPGNYINSCTTSECHGNFKETYNPVMARNDGQQLCLNCHKTDNRGHYDQVNLDNNHISTNASLRIGNQNYIVSCDGCHPKSLTAEHKRVAERIGLATDADCLYCHGDTVVSPVKSVVSDIRTINNKLTDLNTKAGNRNCTKCHFNSAVLIGGPEEHVLYHIATSSDALDVSGKPHKDCNTCHANSKLLTTIYDLAQTPIKDRNYGCFICHNQSFELAPLHVADFEGDLTEITELHRGCATCHTPETEAAEKVEAIITDLKSGSEGYSCVECHYGANLNDAHIGIIDANCTVYCHNPALIDEHINPSLIAQQVNKDSPLNCGTCHKNNNPEVRVAITTGNTSCTACHTTAHDLNISQVPVDIPLYPGYQWTFPQSADIWASEAWMPEGYQGGKLMISNRKKDVNGKQVWDYYREKMQENRWMMISSEPNTNNIYFSMEFEKERRKTTIFFYGGASHSSTLPVESGYRLEILYK